MLTARCYLTGMVKPRAVTRLELLCKVHRHDLHETEVQLFRSREGAKQIPRLEARIEYLKQQIEHAEAASKMLLDDLADAQSRYWMRKTSPLERGDLPRAAMQVLRVADKPMSAREIVSEVLRIRGVSAENNVLTMLTDRLRDRLSARVAQGVISVDGSPRRYWITPSQGYLPKV